MITDTEIKLKGYQALATSLGNIGAERFIALIQSEPFDYTKWQRDLWDNQSVEIFWVLPSSDYDVSEDEPGISKDSDNDGIVDFDEEARFGTDPNHPDSDSDGVPDKQGIREYIFDNNGVYAYGKPVVEVHLTDPKEREEFRHVSYIGMVAEKSFAGLGVGSYLEALEYIIDKYK